MKFFEDEYRENILKTKLLLHNTYVTCGMLPCLLTSTDR